MLEWHAQDPVSDWERRRNERIYERQGNRNPFIDHPEWVGSIYGESCGKEANIAGYLENKSITE
ncbi:endonuclease [Candidatus Regiella insecticola]|uniref:endonuclease n=1 Tax=Candidatus Regiella insecticola TaxID=138073 RepID=UPI0002ECEDE0